MNILFFDTSQGITSICASIDGLVQPAFHDAQPAKQAELLVLQVADYVAQHNMQWRDFAAIGCVNGVGGFTSVRIGVATARGLATAAGVRSVGVELAQVMAYHYFTAQPQAPMQCVIPAGNSFFAVQQFSDSHRISQTMKLLERESFFATKNMCVLPSIASLGGVVFPLKHCAKIAVEMLLAHGISHLSPPIPLYARPPDAKIGTPLLKTVPAGFAQSNPY